MTSNSDYPYFAPAIVVRQPLGKFFVTCIPAQVLLEITFTEPLQIDKPPSSGASYGLRGSQRQESVDRHREIGRYIDTVDAAFPNSIILAANYDEDGQIMPIGHEDRWVIQEQSKHLILHIPSKRPLACIVDGQHRLGGFEHSKTQRLEMELLCAVYLDLPKPLQAYLFATININQRKVDRSLAYELYGFNIEEEKAEAWTPEKLAVFLCRRLNVDRKSPLHGHIIVAPQDDDNLISKSGDWQVSTATVVDGILSLIATKPKRDRDEMRKVLLNKGRTRSLLTDDRSPLRNLYLNVNDLTIYKAVANYFSVVDKLLWDHAKPGSYIRKTVGIQGLFDVLKIILKKNFDKDRNASAEYFQSFLESSQQIDFGNNFFQASGTGRMRIRKAIEWHAGLIDSEALGNDRAEYEKLVPSGS